MTRQDETRIIGRQPGEVLRWSERHQRLLLQYSMDTLELLTTDRTIIYASEALERVLGSSRR